MKIPKPPQRIRGKTRRELWIRVAEDLAKHGLDPFSRIELISDYVEADTQMRALRPQSKGSADVRLATARALNTARAERRRLHARLFAGGARLKPEPVEPEVRADEIESLETSEADEAWRDVLWHERDRPNKRPPKSREELEQKYGRPSWNAMLYPTAEKQAEAEIELERQYRKRPSSFHEPPTRRLRGEE